MERDYYGYGMNPPDMQWPKGAKMYVRWSEIVMTLS